MIPTANWELEHIVYEERSRAAQRRRRNWEYAASLPRHPLRTLPSATGQLRISLGRLRMLAATVEPVDPPSTTRPSGSLHPQA
jgi:hypothetical protein